MPRKLPKIPESDLEDFVLELVALGVAETSPLPESVLPMAVGEGVDRIAQHMLDVGSGKLDPKEAPLVLVACVGLNTMPRGKKLDRGFTLSLVRALARVIRLVPDRFRGPGVITPETARPSTLQEALEEGMRRLDAYLVWWNRAWADPAYGPVLGGAFDVAPKAAILGALSQAHDLLRGRGIRFDSDEPLEILHECLSRDALVGALQIRRFDGSIGLVPRKLRDALDLDECRPCAAPRGIRRDCAVEISARQDPASLDPAMRTEWVDVLDRLLLSADTTDDHIARQATASNVDLAEDLHLSEGAVRKRRAGLKTEAQRLGVKTTPGGA